MRDLTVSILLKCGETQLIEPSGVRLKDGAPVNYYDDRIGEVTEVWVGEDGSLMASIALDPGSPFDAANPPLKMSIQGLAQAGENGRVTDFLLTHVFCAEEFDR